MTDARVTALGAEAWVVATPAAAVTALGAEVWAAVTPAAAVTALGREVWIPVDPPATQDAALVGEAWEVSAAHVVTPSEPLAVTDALDVSAGLPLRAQDFAALPLRRVFDFKLDFDNGAGAADLALTSTGDFAPEAGLETAIIISLGTDAMARDDDELPDGTDDRRGWWGDLAEQPGGPRDETGSRLWLLDRAVMTQETLRRAEQYAADALAWLVTDGVAERVDVTASEIQPGAIGLAILINAGTARAGHYNFIWRGIGA